MNTSQEYPLCADLDGTLIFTDLSRESLKRTVKLKPWIILWLPFWLLRGMAYCKARLAALTELDIARLPWNQPVLDYLVEAKNSGRKVVLVTGSNEKYAQQVARYLALFDEVMASDGNINLTGKNKAARLIERYGKRQFDYIGNEFIDRHIWHVSDKAILVNAKAKLRAKLSHIAFERVFPARPSNFV